MIWDNARILERDSGTWELIGDDSPCARDEVGVWYWVALRKVGDWPIYSGVVRQPPQSADPDELAVELADVVRVAREMMR